MSLFTNVISPEFDVIDDKFIEAISHSAKKLIEEIIRFDRASDKVKYSQSMLSFWPGLIGKSKQDIKDGNFKIFILPLERVEASEGASGSRVLVAYFQFNEETHFSNSVVLKLRDLSNDTDVGYNKLEYEKSQGEALSPLVNGNWKYFVFPHFYSHYRQIGVLWALFYSSVDPKPTINLAKPTLKEDNLWKQFDKLTLRCDNSELKRSIKRGVEEALNAVSIIHMSLRYKQKLQTLTTHYKWYLRKNKWLVSWGEVWGMRKTTNDLGQKWINPIHVFERLKKYKSKITIGAIHGDLHTKNILFTPNRSIRIIDFGWSKLEGHVAKDFLLLESNLRFMILHPDVPYNDLLLLAETLNETEYIEKKFQCPYSKYIHELIFDIRNIAFKVLDNHNIYNEYLIPLFFVSIGLLEFSKTFNNIIGAKLTILELSRLIDKYLNTLK